MTQYHHPILGLAINTVLGERSPVAFFALFHPFCPAPLPCSDLSPGTHGQSYMWLYIAVYALEATLSLLVLIELAHLFSCSFLDPATGILPFVASQTSANLSYELSNTIAILRVPFYCSQVLSTGPDSPSSIYSEFLGYFCLFIISYILHTLRLA